MRCPAALLIVSAVTFGGSAEAQEFSLFLHCVGTLTARSPSGDAPADPPANADFAFRYNSRQALIQGSNVLPVGERLDYVPTPTMYTMTYRLRAQGTQVIALPGWFQTSVLVRYPDLDRLNQIRVSIDRVSGRLDGAVLNERDEVLAPFTMQCEAQKPQDLKTKF